MGKVIEKLKLTSLFDSTKSMEVEPVTDTGVAMFVLPQNLMTELGIKRIRDAQVKYAKGMVKSKWAYGAVTVEVKGRSGIFEVLAKKPGSQPLVGQIILGTLDIGIDPRTQTLIPNPRFPEMPMVEIL